MPKKKKTKVEETKRGKKDTVLDLEALEVDEAEEDETKEEDLFGDEPSESSSDEEAEPEPPKKLVSQ